MSKINEDDYQYAQRVWKEFGIRNLGDYHDLYLRTDVVLLANVFEALRDTCLKHYSLDPAHFYTAPGMAWKACLKKTRVRLELLTDPGVLLMFEREFEEGLPKQFIIMHWPIINIWEISMIPIKNPNTFNTSMPTIFMVGQCLSHFQLANSNGLTLSPVKFMLSPPTKSKDTY